MKRIAIYTITIVGLGMASWGVAGCGSAGADNPPDVSGLYALTNTDCPGSFDTETNVIQDGADVVFQATHAGYLDITGSVDNDGNISASNESYSCNAKFVNGVITGTCKQDGTTCQGTYTRE